ncbi:Hexadecenal dehydrogenase [Friedmanniomyces endolithicus]|nr:Hexadecenal dehydrogenase [Friedmanniomyces endolithicus]
MIYLKMDDLPAFTHTPLDDISGIHDLVVRTFHAHTTRRLQYRLKQLRSLYWGLKDAEPALTEALKLDLGKSAHESWMAEIMWCLNDIVFVCKNLEAWMRDEAAPDIPLMNQLMRPRIRKDPLGAVLIIGAFNFPFMLSLCPLIGAIAAGCTAVLKPSENAPNSARIMQHVIEQSLSPDAYQVVQGGVPETTALLEQKWDKIFYTGNPTVGKIIARKAAETLTPVTLELGGRNPAILSKHADPRLAARRLLWTKLFCAGQVCVSQNYVLVDKDLLPALTHELGQALREFQPNGAKGNEDYSRIVNERQWDRLKSLLDSTKGKILYGGHTDRDTLLFEPTVVQVESADDPLLQVESFGPLIPILAVQDLDEAIRIANDTDATPLAMYAFGSKADNAKVLAETRSGGATLNDAMFHASMPTLPFGGVGDSGQGSYRGRESFNCFTHRRSITQTPGWLEGLIDFRYPPYTAKKFKAIKQMADTPDFDRQGNAKKSLLWWLLLLGGKGSIASAGARWAVFVSLLAVGARMMARVR